MKRETIQLILTVQIGYDSRRDRQSAIREAKADAKDLSTTSFSVTSPSAYSSKVTKVKVQKSKSKSKPK